MSLKERIIEETTGMFITHGIKSIRMDDIAMQMGISKRTIYEIFVDKENLIIACLRHFHDVNAEKMRQVLSGANNIIDEYLLMLDEWDRDLDSKYTLMASVKKFYPKIHEKLSNEYYEEGYAELRRKLEEGIQDGYILKNVNLNLALSVFTYSIYGIIKEQTTLPHNVSERDAFKYVITYFFRGIATDKGIAMIDKHFKQQNRT